MTFLYFGVFVADEMRNKLSVLEASENLTNWCKHTEASALSVWERPTYSISFCWAFTSKHTYIIKRVRVSKGYNWSSVYRTTAVCTNISFFKQRCCIDWSGQFIGQYWSMTDILICIGVHVLSCFFFFTDHDAEKDSRGNADIVSSAIVCHL